MPSLLRRLEGRHLAGRGLRREMGSDPFGARRPLLYQLRRLWHRPKLRLGRGARLRSSPMVENGCYLQNDHTLREAYYEFKYYLLCAVATDYTIKSLREYPCSRSCPIRGLQLV